MTDSWYILLGARYRTVRSAKIATVQEAYKAYGDRVEIVGIDDLINGDFTQALEGKILLSARWFLHLYLL